MPEDSHAARTYRIATLVGLIVLIIVGAWWFSARRGSAPAQDLGLATTTYQIASSTTQQGGVTATGDFSVSNDDTIELPTPPDFRAPVAYAPDVSPEVRTIIEQHVATLQGMLAKDSYDLGAWVDLGAYHKMAGDYAFAETAWVFVTKAAPSNVVAYANLADLYMNFLKDYPKADAMYEKVNTLAPDVADAYISRSLLYENFYKAGGSPEAVLKEGIAANPSSIELQLQLARYYVRAGNNAQAKAAYEAAIELAQKADNPSVAEQIKSEAGI